MSDIDCLSLKDRRAVFNPLRRIECRADRLDCWEDNTLKQRIQLDQVKRVRLTVEPAGQLTQIICRVSDANRVISFSSRRLHKNTYIDQVSDFKILLITLHNYMLPQTDTIEWLEGPSLGLRVGLSGSGLVMLLASLGFFSYCLSEFNSPILALAALPFTLIGASIAWVFRPIPPKLYDPRALIERFKD